MKEKENKEERNQRVTREIWDGLNRGDIKPFAENIADNFVWRGDSLLPCPGTIVGKTDALIWTERVYKLLPGIFTDIKMMAAGGDTVTMIAKVRGSTTQGYMGLPPIDRPWEHHQCIFHVYSEQGKLLEQFFFYDRVRILQQAGLIPDISFFGLPANARWYRSGGAYLQSLFTGKDVHGFGVPGSPGVGEMITDIVLLPVQVMIRGIRAALGRSEMPKAATEAPREGPRHL